MNNIVEHLRELDRRLDVLVLADKSWNHDMEVIMEYLKRYSTMKYDSYTMSDGSVFKRRVYKWHIWAEGHQDKIIKVKAVQDTDDSNIYIYEGGKKEKFGTRIEPLKKGSDPEGYESLVRKIAAKIRLYYLKKHAGTSITRRQLSEQSKWMRTRHEEISAAIRTASVNTCLVVSEYTIPDYERDNKPFSDCYTWFVRNYSNGLTMKVVWTLSEFDAVGGFKTLVPAESIVFEGPSGEQVKSTLTSSEAIDQFGPEVINHFKRFFGNSSV